jgi:hypothetical protein
VRVLVLLLVPGLVHVCVRVRVAVVGMLVDVLDMLMVVTAVRVLVRSGDVRVLVRVRLAARVAVVVLLCHREAPR